MQRRTLLSAVLASIFVALPFARPRPANAQMGYKGQDLQRMGQWLAFNQLELYRLEIPSYAAPYAVALTSGKHGWRIVVFLRDGGEANVDWDSGSLPRAFQLASTDALLLIPKVGDNFGVVFTGCSIKDCKQNYSALLYLPWSHQFFDKQVSSKSVACSQALLDPQNGVALQTLDAALKRQQGGNARYLAPPCPGVMTGKSR